MSPIKNSIMKVCSIYESKAKLAFEVVGQICVKERERTPKKNTMNVLKNETECRTALDHLSNYIH